MSNIDKESRKTVFLSWARNVPRSRGIAEELGAEDFYIEYFKSARPFWLPLRYIFQSIQTLKILHSHKPDVVITMNPPIVLPLTVFLFASVMRSKFLIDSHTGAFSGTWGRFLFLHKYLSRRALATIVTNSHLQKQVQSWGARSVILEDKVPDLPLDWETTPFDRPSLCLISSYSHDEPIEPVFRAAAELPDYDFYVTGQVPKPPPNFLQNIPQNVRLTGFLPRRDYIELLNKVDAIMVLVNADHTLCCGAYEAVAMEKPMILSNWPVLRRYFDKGCVYVDNGAAEIRDAVVDACSRKLQLKQEMKALKQELDVRWQNRLRTLLACMTEAA